MTHQQRFTDAARGILDGPERCRDDFALNRIEPILRFFQITSVAVDKRSDAGECCTKRDQTWPSQDLIMSPRARPSPEEKDPSAKALTYHSGRPRR